MTHSKVYWLTCIFSILLVASFASATTIVMPTDEQLVAKSPLIIEGNVQSSTPVERDGRIWTETKVEVTSVLKGSAGKSVTIREIGGVIGDRITKIFGAPEYKVGEHVLLFLTPTPRGDYQTVDLFVGKFTQQRTLDGTPLWSRHDEAADVVLLDSEFKTIHAANVQRVAPDFEHFVVDRIAGRRGSRNYGIENPILAKDPVSGPARGATDYFTLISEPTVYRWAIFDNGGSASWYSYGTQPGYSGGGVNEVQTAMGVWNNYSAAKIRYAYAGVESGAPGGVNAGPNGVNEVLFNDPKGDISGTWNPSTGGVVGLGGFNGVSGTSKWTAPFTADSAHAQGTYTAYNITEANLTIQDGVSSSAGISSSTLAEICAHEFGHTLGFGHSTDNTALMYPSVTGLGASLRPDDQLAARWLYPNGASTPTPPPPTATVPTAPSGLTATVASSSSVVLRWTDNASNETGESVFYSVNGSAYAKAGDVAAGSVQATLSGLGAGNYGFYVVAFNSAGSSSASNIASASLGSTPPAAGVQASFTVSPSSGIAGQTTFAFTDQSTGSISSRFWQFGDGNTSSAVNPTHVYGSAGTYTVTLTATGSTSSSVAHTVTVTAPQAALVAGYSFSPTAPSTRDNISFFDQSTGGVTGWQWSFGDGTTSTQQNPVKNYPYAGAYTVTLTIYRNNESASTAKMINVVNAAPAIPATSAAFAFSPGSPKVGDAVSFSDRSAGAPTSWSWSFGDGTTSNSQNPVHTYAGPGSYTVSLTAANSVSSSMTSQVVDVAANIQSYQSLVSVAAQTNGVGGSVWRTELTIFNGGNDAANITLTFLPGAGNAVQTRPLFLGAKQSITYQNALLDIFGIGSGAGAVAIDASSPISTPVLKVSSRTFTNGNAGTYGQAVPEVSDLNQTLYLTGLAANSSYRTNVGIVNRSGATATASLTLLNANGGVLGFSTVSVPPNNFQQAPLSSFFPAVAGGSFDALSMSVVSSTANAVSVYASVVDNRTQDPVYIQGTPATGGSTMIIPAVGRAPGLNGTFWRSDVTLYNPTGTPMGVGLRYLPAGSDNRGAQSSSIGIGPGQTVVLSDVVAWLGVQSGSGALELNWSASTGPIVSSRTYTSTTGGGTYGQSIDPVRSFGRDQYVPGLRSDANFRTNVGFVNSGDVAAGITVSLLSATGQTLATGFAAIAPKSQQQFSLSALFPGIAPASLGSFTLQAHTDTAPTIFAYGSIVDNTSGDPVFFAGQ